ncbi:hypothetical protein Tco_0615243 [Tanacetum coccineum]
MIEADEQLAARLQAEEQEQFSIEEKSRMLVEMIAERKKFFATQRAAEQRSKPPTKTQIRNRISETRAEGSSKRARDELESHISKKQKINEHVEAEKDDDQYIEIVKDDEVAIDAIPLATKPPKQLKPIVLNLLLLQPTYTRPKARGVVVQEPSEFKTTSPPLQASQLPQKDQVALDEEMARNLEAQMQAELIEEERLARQKEEESQYSFD